MLRNQAGEEIFQHDRTTGHTPARIEAHAAFGVGQNLDAFCIERVETSIGQHRPVRRLHVVQTFDLMIALEGWRTVRHGLEAHH